MIKHNLMIGIAVKAFKLFYVFKDNQTRSRLII